MAWSIINTAVASIAGLGAAVISYDISKPEPPPVHEILEVQVVPNHVRPASDGKIHINVSNSTKRSIDCPIVRVFRTFTNTKTDEVVYMGRNVGGRLKAGGEFKILTNYIQLPAEKFPPGEYEYSTIAFSRCEDGKTYPALSGTALFTVEP